jgi:hypothetical protein
MSTTLLVVGCLVVAALVGMAWSKWDRKDEARRAAFQTLSIKLREYGLTRLPAILDAYAIGNYSEFIHLIFKFADMLDDGNDVVLKDFDRVYESVLTKKLATAEGRAMIKQRLAEAEGPVVVPTPVVA